jgi:hypothetical protein
VNARKLIGWAVVLFIAFYLLTDPNGAAAFVGHALNGLKSAGRSLSTFISHL